jgi:hypothetical protein
MVGGLGVAQIVSWGSLFYAIGVLAPAMGRDLGLSGPAVFGAYSTGMVASGLVSPAIGRAIDRDGGRRWLAIGSGVAALALLALAAARGPVSFYLAWVIGGVAMAMTLYDTGFMTLSQHFGTRYRTAVTVLTLYGGFASTVFWPLSLYGLEHVGWRATLAGFAVLQLGLCLPLHLVLVPRPGRARRAPEATVSAASAPRPDGRRLFALAAAFAVNAFIAGAMAAHMPSLLGAAGLSAAQAVWAGALFGPMQVAGRIGEMAFLRHWPATRVGFAALTAFAAALAMLVTVLVVPSLAQAFAFAALYGLANGVVTIVRGTAPAELFGRDGYGELLGRIAAPAFVAKAIAPVGFALALSALGARDSVALLAGLALLSLAAFVLAARARPRPTGP